MKRSHQIYPLTDRRQSKLPHLQIIDNLSKRTGIDNQDPGGQKLSPRRH